MEKVEHGFAIVLLIKMASGRAQHEDRKGTAQHEHEVVGQDWAAFFFLKKHMVRPDMTKHANFSKLRLDTMPRPDTARGPEPLLGHFFVIFRLDRHEYEVMG